MLFIIVLFGFFKGFVRAIAILNGYRAEGFAIILGAFFNAFPYTTYTQNVGLLQLSGVKTKNVIYTAGTLLVLLGLVPRIGALTTIIPTPVLGGAMVAMFGMVVAYGINMLSAVEFSSQENLLIIACSVGMGLGMTAVPELFAQMPSSNRILTDNGIVAGSLTAIVLNVVFNVLKIIKQPSKLSRRLLKVLITFLVIKLRHRRNPPVP